MNDDKPSRFRIDKADSGSSRWHVVNAQGDLLLKCPTKRVANALVAFANAPSPDTYAQLFQVSHADFAVTAAYRGGVGPTTCAADPETGMPLSSAQTPEDEL